MFFINGTIYGANVHLQQDRAECDECRSLPDGFAVWSTSGPVLASGGIQDGASLSFSPSGVVSSQQAAATTSEADSAALTEEQRLAKARDDRQDQLTFFTALVAGFAIGLWIEGK